MLLAIKHKIILNWKLFKGTIFQSPNLTTPMCRDAPILPFSIIPKRNSQKHPPNSSTPHILNILLNQILTWLFLYFMIITNIEWWHMSLKWSLRLNFFNYLVLFSLLDKNITRSLKLWCLQENRVKCENFGLGFMGPLCMFW